MNPKQIPLALALALAIGALASGCAQDAPPAPAAETAAVEQAAGPDAHPQAGEAHDADHDHDVSHALGMEVPVPENHVPWQPDAPLVEGMSRVRAAVAGLEAAGPEADEAAVLARAADVDAAIEYMFENCSLDPEPDVALHGVLARLMAGSQALQANPADLAPAHDMAAAVENYERLFDDPNAAAP